MRRIPPIAAALSAFLMLSMVVPGRSSLVPVASGPAATVVATAPPRVAPGALLGMSGNLRALIGLPESFGQDPSIEAVLNGLPIDVPGVHPLGLTAPDGDSLVAVSMTAFPASRKSTLGSYRTGQWPTAGLAERNPKYAAPAGFITVTPENEGTVISKRFHLRDFLTHDQQSVWPKVLVLRTPLIDKLELIGNQLDAEGLPSRLHVMSGFRSPQYNALGVGEKGGRASHSRHMYGDAADIFVDADGDGRMDDLNGDGRVTVDDAKVLFAVAEGVETAHPELVGGLSAYQATSAHGPFVHVDTRGFRARW
jgi:Bacterial protein of unknown function (DUF882)